MYSVLRPLHVTVVVPVHPRYCCVPCAVSPEKDSGAGPLLIWKRRSRISRNLALGCRDRVIVQLGRGKTKIDVHHRETAADHQLVHRVPRQADTRLRRLPLAIVKATA